MAWWITDGVLQRADSAPAESSIPMNIKGKGNIVIPDGVTIISNSAFRACVDLKGITFPDSLTRIGTDAFRGCANLTHVLIPASVESIAENAFRACLSLKLIELSDTLHTIGESAFSECIHLTRIILPENHPHFRLENDILISKDGTLLWARPRLEDAVIPDGVTNIGNAVFLGCRSLISVTLPDGLRRIGENAFHLCDKLSNISLPDSVTELGDEAFAYCGRLENITVPDGVTRLEYSTFEGCSALTSVTLPDGLKSIGNKAFRWCSNLTHIALPKGLENIGDAAFCHCVSLTNLIIPDSVTSIGICAFDRCGSLNEITLSDHVTELGAGALEGFRYLNIPAHLFARLDKDTLNGLDALACPIPLKDAPADIRLKLCIGFLRNPDRYPAELHADYLAHIRKNAAKLTKAAFDHPETLHFMCRKRLISAKEIDTFTAEAVRREAVELTALLLSYQASVLTMKEVAKARQRKEKALRQQEDTVIARMTARADKTGIDGLNFAVTSKLNRFKKRDELKAYITERGGKLMNAMSSKTDYLIINDPSTDSAKYQKAAELGIVTMTENEFLMLAEGKKKTSEIHGVTLL